MEPRPLAQHSLITMKQIATACLLAALLLSDAESYAQPKQGKAQLDSLLAEAPKMKEDTDAVKLMHAIALQYSYINPDEGQRWAERALALAEQIGWRVGEATAYIAIGNNQYNRGAFPPALDAYFKSLRISEATKDKARIAEVAVNIGNVHWRQRDFDKALLWNLQALQLAKELNDQMRMQVVVGNIGAIYDEQGRYSEALSYKLRALHIAEGRGDQRSIVGNTGNIGVTYTKLKQFNAALAYTFRALHLAKDIGDKQSIAINLGNVGEIYYLLAIDSAAIRPDSLVSSGRAANLAKSIDYLTSGVAACREVGLKGAIPEFTQYLSDALILQGDYRGAIGAYKQSVAMRDSLFSTVNNEQITNLETARAVELKNKDLEIAKLKKRNERVLFTGGFVVLLLILGILFRNYRRQQRSNVLLSKEKQRSDDLLLNILPAEVAEELKETGAAHAKQYDAVSVLFTDFVNFTGTAEQLPPQALVKELHECFTAFDAIMERNGLEKIKTIGDAYMAVCGLPVGEPRHAQKTVQAALDILAFLHRRSTQEHTFGIRIGINSGPVVAGIVGVKKFAYDIWGDTVNTAARMEQHGVAGEINISESTYELVKDAYACKYRGVVAAKSKGEVPMYFVQAQQG